MSKYLRILFMISITYILCLAIGRLPVHAEETPLEPVYEGNADGTAALVKWYPINDGGCVDIPETTSDGKKITSIKAGAFSDYTSIYMLNIQENVEYADEAFLAGVKVKELYIPHTLQGKHILDSSGVEKVYFREGRDMIPSDFLYSEWEGTDYDETEISSTDEDGPSGRDALTVLSYESDVQEIGERAFEHCSNLRNAGHLYQVEKLGSYAFSYCENLSSVSLGSNDIPEGLFCGCEKLYVLTFHLNDFEDFENDAEQESALPEMNIGAYAFSGCRDLKYFADIQPVFKTIGEGSFEYCSSLEAINLRTMDIPKRAFSNCTKLNTVNFTGVENIKIGESAFQSCSALKNFDFSRVISVGKYAFEFCGLTGTVRIPSANIDTCAFRLCKSLEEIEFYEDDVQDRYSIGSSAFASCSNLKQVTFTKSLISIGNNAFSQSGLTSLTLPEANINIGNNAFSICNSLTKADLSSATISLGNGVFSSSKYLVSCIFPASVQKMGDSTFMNCNRLAGIVFPKGLSEIPRRTFGACWALKNVSIPEGISIIQEEAFMNCIALGSIQLPDSLRRIGKKAFALNLGLYKLDLGKGVEIIGESAFEGCSNLSIVVDWPETITEIGNFAFKDCTQLGGFSIPDSTLKIGAGVIYNTKVSEFEIRPGVEYDNAEYSSFVGSVTKPEGELGTLSGSSVTSLKVAKGVKSIPNHFYENQEMDDKIIMIDIYESGISIGSCAFRNAATRSVGLFFWKGLPSSIASDAFKADDLDNTGEGFAHFPEEDRENHKEITEKTYGRIIHWGTGGKNGVAYILDDKGALYVFTQGATSKMPDYIVGERPWEKELQLAETIRVFDSTTIGANAFNGANNVSSISFDENVKQIHDNAFGKMPYLKEILFEGNMPSLSENALSGLKSVICYYPFSDSSWDSVRSFNAEQGKDISHHYGGDHILWMERNYISIQLYKDTNYMSNSLSIFRDRKTKYSEKLSQLTNKKSEKTEILNTANASIGDTNNEGVCFGLLSTILLYKTGNLEPFSTLRNSGVWNNDKNYYNFDYETQSYKDVVNYYHLLQYAPSILVPTAQTLKTDFPINPFTSNKKDFLKTVVKHVQSDNLCILSYDYEMNGKLDGHLGICCDYRFGDYHTREGKEHVIKMYDCNDKTSFYYMYISEDCNWFSYKDKNMTSYDTDLQNIYKDMQLYRVEDLNKKELRLPSPLTNEGKAASAKSSVKAVANREESVNHVEIALPAFEKYTLRNAAGNQLVSSSDSLEGDLPIYEVRHTLEKPMFYFETDQSENFKVDDIAGEFKFIAEMEDRCYLVKVSGAKCISISKEAGVEISGEEELDYNLSVLEMNKNDRFTMIEGKAGKELSFGLDGKIFTLKSSGTLSDTRILTIQDGRSVERNLSPGDKTLSFGLNKENKIKTKEELEKETEIPVKKTEASKKTVKVSSIKLTGISKKIARGKKIKLNAKVLPVAASNKKLTWTSSNKNLATVTQTGIVKIAKKAKPGKTVIIAVSAKDGSGKKQIFKIKVMKGAVKKIKLKGYKKTLKAGKAMKLKAKVKVTKGKPVNKKLKWSTSNKKYATVTQTGKVRAKAAGKGRTVKIKVMSTDGTNKSVVKKIKIK